MEPRTARVTVGIAGWEQAELDECFYPVQFRGDGFSRLAFYSRFFDTVEVRAAFWDDSLDGGTAAAWASAVSGNRRFLFNVKLNSAFTHKRSFGPQQTRTMRSLLHELARRDRLGAVLMQFPYSFTNTSANRNHVAKLAQLFAGFPLHVEIRHESWIQPGFVNFLKENSLRPVSVDMPKVRQYPPFITDAISRTAYVRLHGRNEKGWLLNGFDARYDYLYNKRELREIKRRIDVLAAKCDTVVLILNNGAKGKALANALQLQSVLRATKLQSVPSGLLAAFPFLRDLLPEGYSAEVAQEGDLFRTAM
jgi:uncharacterized protein YecE (DUF72 family)